MLWAKATAATLSSEGVPAILHDPIGSAKMVAAVTTAITDAAARVPRTTHFVEVFAGRGETCHTVRSVHNLVAFAVERKVNVDHDLCTLVGMLYLSWLVASIVARGTVHYAPQCSTWITLARFHTRRSPMSVHGDESRRDVVEANHCAAFTWDGGERGR
eukprot:393793-Pyramimonas_sp.AAC.1